MRWDGGGKWDGRLWDEMVDYEMRLWERWYKNYHLISQLTISQLTISHDISSTISSTISSFTISSLSISSLSFSSLRWKRRISWRLFLQYFQLRWKRDDHEMVDEMMIYLIYRWMIKKEIDDTKRHGRIIKK